MFRRAYYHNFICSVLSLLFIIFEGSVEIFTSKRNALIYADSELCAVSAYMNMRKKNYATSNTRSRNNNFNYCYYLVL